ncbi:hypothetical protein [Mediterraneibacter gnavus]|uniref:hypothetical protein n=1 Tax=Mediterraneibacter gnavus TaxID=33038 RepID=UPI0036F39E6D
MYIVLAPLYLKSVRKLQEKRFVFVKILAIIIPENGAKVSKIKCFQFAQQTLSKFFRVPIDYILRKEEEQQQQEQNDRKEIMELYRDMDQYNRDTWIIIGKRLLGGQLHKYNENCILRK